MVVTRTTRHKEEAMQPKAGRISQLPRLRRDRRRPHPFYPELHVPEAREGVETIRHALGIEMSWYHRSMA